MKLQNFLQANEMNIFAIDTSQKTVSVAIMADHLIVADIFIDSGRHHSEVIMPAIQQAFLLAALTPEEIDLFALTVGPGSFTGLRIGAATIKGIALSTGKPVVGVSTLEALALNLVHAENKIICPMLDAQKNQIYTALFRVEDDRTVERIGKEVVIDVDRWLQALDCEPLFLGDGAMKYAQKVQTWRSSTSCGKVNSDRHFVKAAAVAALASKIYQRGEQLDLLRFAPQYLRPSEAEIRVGQQTSNIDKSLQLS